MKTKKRRLIALCSLLAMLVLAAGIGTTAHAAPAVTDGIEQYRPQLSYTPAKGWNNDPNGLVYDPDKGEYHMYYQYYPNDNVWGDMHWGHAVSTDLVHWAEKDIAIYPLFAGNDLYKANAVWENGVLKEVTSIDGDATVPTGTIFSGSVVYVSEANAEHAYHGKGFYAIFTQPKSAEERWWDVNKLGETLNTDQRQTIAYSEDGNFFAHGTFREILPVDYEGRETEYPDSFRDPKVFWDDELNKWMMVVGGGEVLQFTSENLLDWEYLGSTGFWGECPDLFALSTPNGAADEKTWVLLISPKNEAQSHAYNGTTAAEYAYDNEYYILGSRNAQGLFVPADGEKLRPFSYGIDSYAGQTFTGSADGKRYGVSWAASWNTVSEYAVKNDEKKGTKNADGLRENWNGGMTLVYEVALAEADGKTTLVKTPAKSYESLRGETLYSENGVTLGENNVLAGKNASLAEADITLDTENTAATKVTLRLAASDYEQTEIVYDIAEQTLTIDRSRSSLAAKNTSRYRMPYAMPLAPDSEGKVRIRAWLDWGNLFVTGGKGEVSANVAIFPSLSSNGMSLTADGAINASVAVYKLQSARNNAAAAENFDGFYLSAKKSNLHVGESLTVLACSPNPAFAAADVQYSVTGSAVTLSKRADGSLQVTAQEAGRAKIRAEYGGKTRECAITVYAGNAVSDLAFTAPYMGEWVRDNGYVGTSAQDKNAFIFTAQKYTNFILRADVTAAGDNAAAFGFAFGADDNFRNFACANYDYTGKEAKIWTDGGETLVTAPLALRRGQTAHYELSVTDGEISAAVNGMRLFTAQGDIVEGYVGLNVYNGSFRFDNVRFIPVFTAGEEPRVAVGDEAFLLYNATDKIYLSAADYAVNEGELTLADSYLASLVAGKTYEFALSSAAGVRAFTVITPENVSVMDEYRVLGKGEALEVALNLGSATVLQVFINGKEAAFTERRGMLAPDKAALQELKNGDNVLRICTDEGVLLYTFGYEILPPAPRKITGMVVSIIAAVLALAIAAAGVVYWIVAAKRKDGSENV